MVEWQGVSKKGDEPMAAEHCRQHPLAPQVDSQFGQLQPTFDGFDFGLQSQLPEDSTVQHLQVQQSSLEFRTEC